MHVERPVYYGVEVEKRVEVPAPVHEVPVPVEVPVYHDLPRDMEVARIGGGWALIDERSKSVDQDLFQGRSRERPPRSELKAEYSGEAQQIADMGVERTRFGRVKPKSVPQSHGDAPKLKPAQDPRDVDLIEGDLELLKGATSYAMQAVGRAEAALDSANRASERAHKRLEDRNMREYVRNRPNNQSPLNELKEQRSLDEEWNEIQRQLHETASLVALRERRLDAAWLALEAAEENFLKAVAGARAEVAARARRHESLEAMQERHAAELAARQQTSLRNLAWRARIVAARG